MSSTKPTKQEIAKAIVRMLRNDAYMGNLSYRVPGMHGIPQDMLLPVIDWLEGLIAAPETKEIAETVKRIEQALERQARGARDMQSLS